MDEETRATVTPTPEQLRLVARTINSAMATIEQSLREVRGGGLHAVDGRDLLVAALDVTGPWLLEQATEMERGQR